MGLIPALDSVYNLQESISLFRKHIARSKHIYNIIYGSYAGLKVCIR